MKKKIAYITGSRAEYGIVKRLLNILEQDKDIDFSLIVTAMHLSEQYGETYKIIEKDGFSITHKIPFNLNTESNQGIITSMAECLDKFGKHFQKNVYDAIIILGDRYEMLSVATAAAMHNIPIIHLHGGEQTLGNYDEFIRHSITKMSKLHLTSTEAYRQRVIQLGEAPDTVLNVGSLGAENGLIFDLPRIEELSNKFGDFEKPYFVVVFHPETLNHFSVLAQVNELLAALDDYKEKYDFIFIGSNSDTNSDIIFDRFKEYTSLNNFRFFSSVSPEEYLGLIKSSIGIIGNSSSGLLEAPSFKVGTINIGDRQKGRVRGETVIDVDTKKEEIVKGINKLLSDSFQKNLPNMENPYYKGNTLQGCYNAIKNFINSNNIESKIFYDIKNNHS